MILQFTLNFICIVVIYLFFGFCTRRCFDVAPLNRWMDQWMSEMNEWMRYATFTQVYPKNERLKWKDHRFVCWMVLWIRIEQLFARTHDRACVRACVCLCVSSSLINGFILSKWLFNVTHFARSENFHSPLCVCCQLFLN